MKDHIDLSDRESIQDQACVVAGRVNAEYDTRVQVEQAGVAAMRYQTIVQSGYARTEYISELSDLDTDALRRELAQSKARLAALRAQGVETIADTLTIPEKITIERRWIRRVQRQIKRREMRDGDKRAAWNTAIRLHANAMGG